MQYTLVKTEYMTKDIVSTQLRELKKGFNKLIPAHKVNNFGEGEFEKLLCGLSIIDVDEWRESSKYRGSYHAGHKVVQWFWDVLETWN